MVIVLSDSDSDSDRIYIKKNLIHIKMDKVIVTQQNKPINHIVKIKQEIKNNVNKNLVKYVSNIRVEFN